MADLADRLWAKVEQRGPGECWPWTGAKNGPGRYGVLRVDGRLVTAHRVVWMLANGRIPDGLCVLHSCDNPGCCNPAHLWLGTHAENLADMRAKGRARPGVTAPGERNHNAVLTEQIVAQIRETYARGVRRSEIAKELGVGWSTVNDVVSRRTWAEI